MKEAAQKLFKLFTRREKKKLIMLFMMMIVAAILETAGIGLIAPFVGLVTNPEIIQEQPILSYVYELLGFNSSTAFIIFAVIMLLSVFVLKNLYLLLFNYAQFRVVLNQQVKLSRDLFKEYLTKPYAFHLQRNSADLLRNVNGEVSKVFQGIIISSFQLFTELLIIFCIVSLLLVTAPVATLAASALLGGSVYIFFAVIRKKISRLGKEQQRVSGTMIQWVNQGLGASKEVKVSGKESFFINSYTGQSQIKANNSRYMKMLEQAPRYFIETLLVSVVLITMLIIVFQGTGTTELISTMALFAMAAFRLMPSITRVVSLSATIRYSQPALEVVYEDLIKSKQKEAGLVNKADTAIVNKGDRAFTDSISLNDVSFRYPDQHELAVDGVSLTIPIGQSAAFVGESGAGKTTLVDIILGLFTPEKGNVLLDGESIHSNKALWQQKIGYIPQFIFLSDDTIRGNVAFGIDQDKIDDQEVWRALEQAQLKEFVEWLPDKLDTSVGEGGVRLSGGQRQRIGIARALYNNPEILFMDEATSALDNDTEKEIMKAIDGLKGEKTLIIIAHRLSTIENCDLVFKINNGRLISTDQNLKRSVM
ncbi:ABC-type multidrug transport system, ATPase and permease component [Lentibacillus persicus]|uniref:ABC-type multidrug transport system, ATPase and permease component n=1 Tax=Lentibacillus persicus TaxID=640948 RepID=A0A1I1U800_9BACI|nr:ABC transporter ATP-binding protein [Lentibacillus persicus]SFD66899.1 ABC-type multidrug transport system, ATPase and permease component [Lentibacillus persicus]